MRIACVMSLHLPASVEMRRPDLKKQSVIIFDRSLGLTLVVDHFPAAAGVSAGMALGQALSCQTGVTVLEAEEAAYRREFRRMLAPLQGVSIRVEGAEPGTAYMGLDGLESLYGGGARLLPTLLNAVSKTRRATWDRCRSGRLRQAGERGTGIGSAVPAAREKGGQ